MTAPAPKVHRLLAPPRPGRHGAWLYALRTTNPPPDRPIAELDGVTRWLVVTRAAVLPMTVVGGLVAGLLGVRADGFSYGLWLLALVGITLAHTSNNLLNDLADTDVAWTPTATRARCTRRTRSCPVSSHAASCCSSCSRSTSRTW